MSAPNKKGLDYFPHDVDLSSDQKIEYLEAELGIVGYAIYLKLLEKIYRVGYFLHWTERDNKLFAKHNNIEVNVCINGVNVCINEGLFSQELYRKYSVLTSKSIQNRYLEASSRRKTIKMYKNFLLLDKKSVSAYKNVVIVDINRVNVDINRVIVHESKVKESKEKKNIKKKRFYNDESNEMKLSHLLFDLILKRNPNQKRPDFYEWSETVNKMIQLDGLDPLKIKLVILWCQKDTFWKNNILSMKKLRKHFDALYLKMNEENKKGDWKNIGRPKN